MEADQREQMVTVFQHYDAYAKATMAVPDHRATRCGVASLLVVVLRAPLFFQKLACTRCMVEELYRYVKVMMFCLFLLLAASGLAT